MNDPINPKHYKHLPAEAIEIIEAAIAEAPSNESAYLHGQVLKYLLRCWSKKGVEDLRKAKWYLDRMVALFDETIAEASGESDEPSEDRPPKGWRKMEIGEDIDCNDKFWFCAEWMSYEKDNLPRGKLTGLHVTHIRKIKPPSVEPTPWTPKIGDWVKVAKPVDCVTAHKIWWVKDMDQFDGKVMQVTSVSLCPPWAALNNKAYDFDFSWLLLVEDPRGQPASKQYREPTLADLRDGSIKCEYRDNDDEQWRSGLLAYVLSGSMPFLCKTKEEQFSGQWAQCRIEAAE